MKEYHVSVDSGGSKIKAVLYDEGFFRIASASTGSIRGNSTPKALCDQNLKDLMAQLFTGHDEIRDIAVVHGSMEREIVEAIAARGSVGRTVHDGEGRLGLAAAGIDGEGLLCLSGTGATMFYLNQDGKRSRGMGGYGAVVFDEGSGYHIGRLACAEAIRYDEGRGKPTLLYEMIAAYFGIPDNFRRALFHGVYENPGRAPVAAVASLAPVVSQAAYRGDETALAILKQAGGCLGSQMNALIRQCGCAESVPMTVSGSTYRGHIALYDSLCQTVREENPGRAIIKPMFEPVIGGLLSDWFEQGRLLNETDREFLKNEYQDYIFTIGENQTC
ncbi:MAG: BadF/BadG/BcrA/BcrD ATPase family protein [Clostridiaceae bacterium]|nr:BadF/BadG/BcrA/BcrD ATPase family protein [Clostridiaceae bacterium]